jgi:DNA-binding transcriptional regulator YiaG
MSIGYSESTGGLTMKSTGKTQQPRILRQRLGLNQQQFWSAVGVTQSGGSRYESGRNIPRPVSELLRLVHVEGIDLARVRGEHFVIADHLRNNNPALYRKIKHQVRAKAGRNTR